MKASSTPTAITVPGRPERQDGEIVEQPPAARLRAQVDIGDGGADDHGADAGRGRETEAVEDAAHRDLVVEQGLVEIAPA